ncbi:hypothetical protein MMC17_006505 [Xylographa soralifera]|nr:hypothetical protein [Xylographa soralifera]
MAPTTSRQWVIEHKNSFEGLNVEETNVSGPGDYEVLVKFCAVALNWRDVMIARGTYMRPTKDGVILCSDGAGEIVTTGPKVTRFKSGQRVATNFFQSFIAGKASPEDTITDLGGHHDGTLREYAVFNENGLVEVPAHLSFLEASTLPCAALTAWNSLYGPKPLMPGDTVLTQGTGGVALFALQFAAAAGAEVISTTSSTAKCQKLKELGAHHVINYRDDENWGETAKKLSLNGRGVDHVIEIGGPNTMAQSLKAVSIDGEIAVIGTRGGPDGEKASGSSNAHHALCSVRRVLVGNRLQFEEMNRAIAVNKIRPVIDPQIFKFEQARDAFQYLADGKQVGKVVIEF